MTITIIPRYPDSPGPADKLADVELHFDQGDGLLAGLKLIGFAVWETRGRRNVTFPARQYSVNGERRSFALLRPTSDPQQQSAIRDAILQAYAETVATVAQQTQQAQAQAQPWGF